MNWRIFIGYFLLALLILGLKSVLNQFTDDKNSNEIILFILIGLILVFSFFSLKKNFKIIKNIPSERDVPQDLIINGIRLKLSVITIAWIKIVFLSLVYFLVFWLVTDIYQAPERKRQHEIDEKKNEEQIATTLLPFNLFLKNIGTFTPLTNYVSPYRRGKILPFNSETNSVDKVFFLLPQSLAPKDTSEIGMIIKLTRQQKKVGTYDDNTFAFQRSISLRFYDLKTSEVFGGMTIYGTPPPNSKSDNGDNYGGDPEKSLIEFFENLPLKK